MSTIAPITAAAARTLIDGGALLVDVRSSGGRATAGTIPTAIVVAKSDAGSFAQTLDADRAVVVFCGSIDGSGPFVDFLDAQGFSNVSHVDGGFEALKSEGIPTDLPTGQ
jgi:rhodanese-related sulfurtransferase